jgi:hypothetical protein
VLSQFKLRDGESGAFGFSQPSGDSYAGAPAYEDDEYQPQPERAIGAPMGPFARTPVIDLGGAYDKY